MRKYIHTKLYFGLLLTTVLLVGCQKQPQKVRILNENPVLDSTMMAQLQVNIHLADVADRECKAFVEADSITYAMDDFGFWYSHTIRTQSDSLMRGQLVALHMQVYLLTDSLIADICEEVTIGSNELPLAISRGLLSMRAGEQMHIIAPWYTAYGVEGTKLIPPYTNVKFIISTIE